MFCTRCGVQVAAQHTYCPNCGTAQPGNVSNKRLFRPQRGRKVGGVCLAVANHFDVDVTLIRVIWVMVCLFPVPMSGVLVYVICWIVMPSEEDVVFQPMPVPPPVQRTQNSSTT